MIKLGTGILFASTIFLAGCESMPKTQASTPVIEPGYGGVAASFQFNVNGTIGTARQHGVELPNIAVDIVPDSDAGSEPTVLSTSTRWNKPNARLATLEGDRVMNTVALKPGRYKFRRLSASFNTLTKKSSLLPTQDIVFDVKEGEVTYIGNIRAIATLGRDNQGQLTPTAIALSVRDEFATDAPKMKKTEPGLGAYALQDGLRL